MTAALRRLRGNRRRCPEMTRGQEKNSAYRVQVGAYRNRGYAQNLAQKLIQDGFSAEILKDGPYYKVVSGSFENLDNAVRLEKRLRQAWIFDLYYKKTLRKIYFKIKDKMI